MTDDPLARISVAPLANVPIIHVCYIFSSRSKGKVQGFHSTIGVLVSKRTHCHTGCLEFAFFFFSFSQFSSICFESILHSYPTADHALCAFSSCGRCFQKLFFFFRSILRVRSQRKKSNQVKPKVGQMADDDP